MNDIPPANHDFNQEMLFYQQHALDRIQSRLKQVISLGEKQTKKLLANISLEKQKLLQDKISFVFGVSFIWITSLVFGKFTEWFHLYYVVVIIPLIITRYVLYKKLGWHYFLADLCYFVNFLLLVLLYNPSRVLFIAVFGLANGPVAWAIYAWRNALVFHSFDKMTSIVIHIFPPLVIYSKRWFSQDEYLPVSYFISIFIPILMYLLWQALYCYIIIDLNKHKFYSRERITSFSWMLDDFLTKKQNSFLTKLAHKVGESNHLYLFMTANFAYAFCTLLPVYFAYTFFWFHTLYIILLVNISVFNGADFYMEVFAKRYVSQVEAFVKENSLKVHDRS